MMITVCFRRNWRACHDCKKKPDCSHSFSSASHIDTMQFPTSSTLSSSRSFILENRRSCSSTMAFLRSPLPNHVACASKAHLALRTPPPTPETPAHRASLPSSPFAKRSSWRLSTAAFAPSVGRGKSPPISTFKTSPSLHPCFSNSITTTRIIIRGRIARRSTLRDWRSTWSRPMIT